jgi:hypoxanthine phosphoribosyltransferase
MNSVPRVLFTAEQIAARVADLAAEIDLRFGERQPLVLVGVLKGSFIFLSDLARRLQTPHRVEFIAVTSYGASTSTEHTGAVRLLMDLRHDIEDAHVLLVEDIVDTGHTLAYLIRLLGARRPASLGVVALLAKPERTRADVKIDYLGFSIPDVWVVGYGLDWAERHRTLPYIGLVETAG